MMRKLFFLLFLLVSTHYSFSQETVIPSSPDDTAFTVNDEDDENTQDADGFAKDVLGDTSVNFNELSIKLDTVAAYRKKKDYQWISSIDSFLLAQKKEEGKESKISIKENTGNSFLSRFINSGMLQLFMWMIVGSIVFFIIYKLFFSEAVFGRRRTKSATKLMDEEEDDELANDYETLLRKAYEKEELRLAMRFLFLKTLQSLNQSELIKYTVDKTNSMYVTELPQAKKNDFASLALYYEYVWYGKVDIEKDIFDAIENKFNIFLNKI